MRCVLKFVIVILRCLVAYHYAKADTALKLRKQEIELANVGSPLAVQLTNSYLLNMDSDEDL